MTLEEITNNALKSIPFIVPGKNPIELTSFDTIEELKNALKQDLKDKFTIKYKQLVEKEIERYNVYKWDTEDLSETIKERIEGHYDIFNFGGLGNEDFFDYDEFYNWTLLYSTFKELNVNTPYDEYVLYNILDDVKDELEKEWNLLDMIGNIIESKKCLEIERE